MNRPSFPKAIKAKCKECMGGYRDGRLDCQIPTCPLYYWMPYREMEPQWEYVKRKSSPAQMAALAKASHSRSIPQRLSHGGKDSSPSGGQGPTQGGNPQ